MKDNDKVEMAVPPEEPPKNRRTVLKSMVAGSAVVTGSQALSDKWTKPLTNAVILPGHARTTGPGDFNVGDEALGRASDGYKAQGDGSGYYYYYYGDSDGPNQYQYSKSYGHGDGDGSDADYTYGDSADDGVGSSDSDGL